MPDLISYFKYRHSVSAYFISIQKANETKTANLRHNLQIW